MHGRLLLGYRIVSRDEQGDGVRRHQRLLGRVVDLAVVGGRLALIGECGSLFGRRRRLIPWSQVQSWQVGRVEVAPGEGREPLAAGILGRRVGGGVVSDVRFAPDGRVEALELSWGVVRDLLHGRVLVPYAPHALGGELGDLPGLRLEGHGTRGR